MQGTAARHTAVCQRANRQLYQVAEAASFDAALVNLNGSAVLL